MNKPEPQARLIIQNYSDEFSFLCHVLPEYEERLKELAEPYCSSVRSDFGGVVAIAMPQIGALRAHPVCLYPQVQEGAFYGNGGQFVEMV